MEYTQKSVRLPRTPVEREKWKRVIIILEHCPLQSIQTDRGFELLSERHRSYHVRHPPSDPAEWRPDVVHQCLLHLQDSALNRAGKLEVYLCTKKGICIAVDPRLRIPRHMHLFEKMMVTLLFKMRVRASTGYLSLLRVVKNPITDHIPANTRLYRVEKDGELITNWGQFCQGCSTGDEMLILGKEEAPRRTTGEAPGDGGPSSSSNHTSEKNDEDKKVTEQTSVPLSSSSLPHDSRTSSESGNNHRDRLPPPPGVTHDQDTSDTMATTTTSPSSSSYVLPAAGTLSFSDLHRQQAEAEEFRPFAFIVGGMSKGDVTVEYASAATGTKSIRLSDRGMSAAAVLSQLLYAFEEAWLKEDNEMC